MGVWRSQCILSYKTNVKLNEMVKTTILRHWRLTEDNKLRGFLFIENCWHLDKKSGSLWASWPGWLPSYLGSAPSAFLILQCRAGSKYHQLILEGEVFMWSGGQKSMTNNLNTEISKLSRKWGWKIYGSASLRSHFGQAVD